jgi:hypothetical protein
LVILGSGRTGLRTSGSLETKGFVESDSTWYPTCHQVSFHSLDTRSKLIIRGAIWQLMSSSKDLSLEESYKALLKIPSPHEKAIQKDLSRTFPHHKFFQEGGGTGQEGLFMVVKAYSLYVHFHSLLLLS